MSNHNHNYSQYSNKNNQRVNRDNAVKPVEKASPEVKMVVEHAETTVKPVYKPVENTVKPVATPEIKPVVETVNTVTVPETVEGVVANCAKLNVRVAPNIDADVIGVLDAMSEIEIDVNKSTRDWFHVCTAVGIEGYCMRKYIDAHL